MAPHSHSLSWLRASRRPSRRPELALVAALALIAGCFDSGAKTCSSGLVCPADLECSRAGDRCAPHGAIMACAQAADGDPCSWSGTPSGGCVGGVCVPNGCGNDILEPGEVCDDGNTNPGDGCSSDCRSTEVCGNAIKDEGTPEECDCGDGQPGHQPPTGCNGPNSDAPGATCRTDCTLHRCGDGIVEPPEECEGTNLAGHTCADIGYYNGTPTCTPQCRLDRSGAGCTGRCGDGVVDPSEQCDTTALAGRTCGDFGFYQGALACTPLCSFDVSGCSHRCGDGVKDAQEQCDMGDFGPGGTPTCQSLNYYSGTQVSCTTGCSLDESMCSGRCGDGIINGPELCEGSPPPGSCTDYGFDFGALACSSCQPSFASCHALGWKPVVHLADNMNAVWALSSTDQFAVSNGGVIEHFDGTAWSAMTSPTTSDLYGIWGASPTNVWAVGGPGAVLHYDGTAWTSVTPPVAGGYLAAVWGISSTTIIVAGAAGVFSYNGATWTALGASPSGSISTVWASSTSDVYVNSSPDTIWHWNGSTWTAVYTDLAGASINAVWGSSASDVWFVGATAIVGGQGLAVHWNGTAATRMTVASSSMFNAISGSSSTDVFTAGDGMARWDGQLWSQVPVATGFPLIAIDVPSPGVGVAADGNATLLDYHTGYWSPLTSGTTANLLGVTSAGLDDAIAVGASATVLHYTGSGWSSITPTAPSNIFAGVWAASPSLAFVAGYSSLTSGYLNQWNGSGWATPNSPVHDMEAIWGSGPTNVWASGGFQVAHYTGSWALTLDKAMNAISGTSASNIWGISGQTAIFHYTGASWSVVTVSFPQTPHDVFLDAPTSIWVVGDNGMIIHSDGVTWTPVASGVATGLNAIWGSGPNDIWAGGSGGTVVHYDGASWQRVASGTISDINDIAGFGGKVYFVGTDGTIRLLVRSCASCL